MLLRKKWKRGRTVNELVVGEKLQITEKIEDKDLLLYLGLTNDNNPLYVQYDYASETSFKKPIVPTIMLNGLITSAISKYLPGPGAHIIEMHLTYPAPLYHYEIIDITLEILELSTDLNEAYIEVFALNENQKRVMEGLIKVVPPKV